MLYLILFNNTTEVGDSHSLFPIFWMTLIFQIRSINWKPGTRKVVFAFLTWVLDIPQGFSEDLMAFSL